MRIETLLTRIALTGIVSLMSGISIAQEIPKLKQNMPYSKARNILIKAGWQPASNQEQINNSNRSAPVNYFITKKKYTEIVDCAGSGLGLCLFQFKNTYGKMLFVTTANNEANQETVFSWRTEQTKQTSTKVNIGCALVIIHLVFSLVLIQMIFILIGEAKVILAHLGVL